MEATKVDAEAMGLDPMSTGIGGHAKLKPNKFQSEALKEVIGEARAALCLQSISMGAIPAIGSTDSLKNGGSEIQKTRSM